jgi:integrase/recombinase XerD
MLSVGEKWLTMYIHIDAHLEHCRARGFSRDTTIPSRRAVLERICRAYGDLHAITAQQLEKWLAGPEDPDEAWDPQTRATYFGHIRGYFRWAQRAGLVPVNPTDLLDRPRVPYRETRSTSAEAFRHILRNSVEPYLTAALLAGYAGLRCCEIVRADRADISGPAPHGVIRVLGKGGRVDEIPTHPQIWQHIRGRREGPLVRDTHGQAYRPNTLSRLFAVYARRKLDTDITLHRLRHLYANTLRRSRDANGDAIDIEVVRMLTRHRSLNTLQRYLCAEDEERRNAILALPVVA